MFGHGSATILQFFPCASIECRHLGADVRHDEGGAHGADGGRPIGRGHHVATVKP